MDDEHPAGSVAVSTGRWRPGRRHRRQPARREPPGERQPARASRSVPRERAPWAHSGRGRLARARSGRDQAARWRAEGTLFSRWMCSCRSVSAPRPTRAFQVLRHRRNAEIVGQLTDPRQLGADQLVVVDERRHRPRQVRGAGGISGKSVFSSSRCSSTGLQAQERLEQRREPFGILVVMDARSFGSSTRAAALRAAACDVDDVADGRDRRLVTASPRRRPERRASAGSSRTAAVSSPRFSQAAASATPPRSEVDVVTVEDAGGEGSRWRLADRGLGGDAHALALLRSWLSGPLQWRRRNGDWAMAPSRRTPAAGWRARGTPRAA